MLNRSPIKHVFIITYGRSGSTLLQGILNSSPKIHVTGENGDFLYNLYEAYLTIKSTKETVGRNKNRTSREPFYGIDFFEEDEIRPHVKSFVDSQILKSCPPEKAPSVLGFKEIRYPYRSNLPKYIDFINETFENSVFLILFRNIDHVLDSGMHKEMELNKKAILRQQFEKFELEMATYARAMPNLEIIQYEDLRKNVGKLHVQLTKQGLPVSLEAIRETLLVPHSYMWKKQNV